MKINLLQLLATCPRQVVSAEAALKNGIVRTLESGQRGKGRRVTLTLKLQMDVDTDAYQAELEYECKFPSRKQAIPSQGRLQLDSSLDDEGRIRIQDVEIFGHGPRAQLALNVNGTMVKPPGSKKAIKAPPPKKVIKTPPRRKKGKSDDS